LRRACGLRKKSLTKRCSKIPRIFGILENLMIFDGNASQKRPRVAGHFFVKVFGGVMKIQ